MTLVYEVGELKDNMRKTCDRKTSLRALVKQMTSGQTDRQSDRIDTCIDDGGIDDFF